MPPSPPAPDAVALRLLQGGEADLPFLMATERLPGYEHLVGRRGLARHRRALANGRHVCFLARRGAQPVGFAILRDWGSPEKVTSVRCVAVAQPGERLGRAVIALVADAVFTQTDAYCLWLSLFLITGAPTRHLASSRKACHAAALISAARTATSW